MFHQLIIVTVPLIDTLTTLQLHIIVIQIKFILRKVLRHPTIGVIRNLKVIMANINHIMMRQKTSVHLWLFTAHDKLRGAVSFCKTQNGSIQFSLLIIYHVGIHFIWRQPPPSITM